MTFGSRVRAVPPSRPWAASDCSDVPRFHTGITTVVRFTAVTSLTPGSAFAAS